MNIANRGVSPKILSVERLDKIYAFVVMQVESRLLFEELEEAIFDQNPHSIELSCKKILAHHHNENNEISSRIDNKFKYIDQFIEKIEGKLQEHSDLLKVYDLTKGVSINDRLLYMNELFNKDMTALDKALRALNSQNSWLNARNYLRQLMRKNKWLENKEILDIVHAFVSLTYRRFV